MEDCYRDTGKPPIPVRWVVTNEGDELHPNVRCRLVAKHMAAKYGGEEAEDLFAAMPPFELIKSLLIKAVQRNNWKTMKRKVTFIEISKAHLYAPVDKGTSAYVDSYGMLTTPMEDPRSDANYSAVVWVCCEWCTCATLASTCFFSETACALGRHN